MITDYKFNDFIDTEYKTFALYTLEQRAIPSVIDGMKVVHRKLLYSMLQQPKDKLVKVAELGGSIAKFGYLHGETSAQDAAVKLAAPHYNNESLFFGDGNFGTRLVPKAASPRYIYAALSDAYEKYFKDTELTEAKNEDHPEPKHYFPVIPWILVNGAEGMSVGFKCAILPRSVIDIKKAVLSCIKDRDAYLKKSAVIVPTIPEFRGKVEHVEGNQYRMIGIVEYVGKYTYKVSEVPDGYDRKSYIEHLESLIEKDLIKDYEDECNRDGFGFSVKVGLNQKAHIDKIGAEKFFGLIKTYTEILTTIGSDGKLKIFNNIPELVAYFVEYRLDVCQQKLHHLEQRHTEDIQKMQDEMEFLDRVISGKLKPSTMSKSELLEYIQESVTTMSYGKSFIDIPLYRITKDSIEELQKKIDAKIVELNKVKSTTNIDLMISYLKG